MKPKKTSAKLGKPTLKVAKVKSALTRKSLQGGFSKPSATTAGSKLAPKKTVRRKMPATKQTTAIRKTESKPEQIKKKKAPASRASKVKRTEGVVKPSRDTVKTKTGVVKKVARKTGISRKPPELQVPAILLQGDAPPTMGVSGPGERYALGPGAPPPHWSIVEKGELPESYGTKDFTITARDPEWLFACWDLTLEQQKDYNRLSADGHLVLKVYLDAIEGSALTEAHVHPESRHWFVHVGRGGCRFVAQIGYYSESGRWVVISTSNSTMTPPNTLAETEAASFATLPPQVPFQELVSAVQEAAKEQKPLAEAILEIVQEAQQAEAPKETEPKTPEPLVATEPPPPTERVNDIHGVREIINPVDPVEHATPANADTGRAFVVNAVKKATAHSPQAALHTPVLTPEQEVVLAKVLSVDEVRRVWVGSMEITELVRRQMLVPGQHEHEIGALDSMAAAGITIPNAPRGIPPAGGISSPTGAPPEQRPSSFWFNVNAELVIYGATDPNATVQMGNRRIMLRKDGTFSYRFALPDGIYELPVTATAPDMSETRCANLKFSRQTEYQGRVDAHPQDPLLKHPSPDNI